MAKSPKERTNTRKAPARIPGSRVGSVTVKKPYIFEPPSILDASGRLLSNRSRAASVVRVTNGKKRNELNGKLIVKRKRKLKLKKHCNGKKQVSSEHQRRLHLMEVLVKLLPLILLVLLGEVLHL